MAWSGANLAKRDLASQSDPFLLALRQRPTGGPDDWVPVFKTEASASGLTELPMQVFSNDRGGCCVTKAHVILHCMSAILQVRSNNANPLWQPIEVDIRQLCAADESLPLRLQVG
jgi:hypothetical protein